VTGITDGGRGSVDIDGERRSEGPARVF